MIKKENKMIDADVEEWVSKAAEATSECARLKTLNQHLQWKLERQRKNDIEKALAYWHKLLDSQGINQVVFVEFVEYMEEHK